MLARVANNLFWMGRYIERSEHIARYLSVSYFTSLDAPTDLSQSRPFVLRSMLFVANEQQTKNNDELIEQDVLFDIGLNPDKDFSIFNSIKKAQHNANGARDLISTELYESVNTLNRYVKNYSPEVYLKNGLFEFTTMVIAQANSLRTKIRSTLLHDEVYAIIMLGIYIERANQVVRIINSKYNDALIQNNTQDIPINTSFEWATLLKCVETFDMMRKHYRKAPNMELVLEFLILNPNCPRSIMYALNNIQRFIRYLTVDENPSPDSAAFLIGKLRAEYEYKTIDDVQGDLKGFIKDLVTDLLELGDKMDKDYFSLY